MQTFAEVVHRWPTAEELARDLGISGVRTRQWRNRDGIPPEVWPELVEAAQARGFSEITIELLADIAIKVGKTRAESDRRRADAQAA